LSHPIFIVANDTVIRDMQMQLKALKLSNEELLESVRLTSHRFDSKLTYFGDDMSRSGKSDDSKTRKKKTAVRQSVKSNYGDACLFCGTDEGVTCAHIVADTPSKSYEEFGKLGGYKDDLDVKSVRNFIPLCGTKGELGTCHNEFDTFGITLLYNPLTTNYVIGCLNQDFKPELELNLKDIAIKGAVKPYRRLLAWRAKYCAQTRATLFTDLSQEEQFLNLCNFSAGSRSDAEGGGSSISSSIS
jgi:hypothetical protein